MISTERPIIEIARSAGWCFGVERIVEMAEKLLNETHTARSTVWGSSFTTLKKWRGCAPRG
jgi:hypothetical protein